MRWEHCTLLTLATGSIANQNALIYAPLNRVLFLLCIKLLKNLESYVKWFSLYKKLRGLFIAESGYFYTISAGWCNVTPCYGLHFTSYLKNVGCSVEPSMALRASYLMLPLWDRLITWPGQVFYSMYGNSAMPYKHEQCTCTCDSMATVRAYHCFVLGTL